MMPTPAPTKLTTACVYVDVNMGCVKKGRIKQGKSGKHVKSEISRSGIKTQTIVHENSHHDHDDDQRYKTKSHCSVSHQAQCYSELTVAE
jgi:hypothetical protein